MIVIVTRDDIHPSLHANGITLENAMLGSFVLEKTQIDKSSMIIFHDGLYFRIFTDKTRKTKPNQIYEIMILPIILTMHKNQK